MRPKAERYPPTARHRAMVCLQSMAATGMAYQARCLVQSTPDDG